MAIVKEHTGITPDFIVVDGAEGARGRHLNFWITWFEKLSGRSSTNPTKSLEGAGCGRPVALMALVQGRVDSCGTTKRNDCDRTALTLVWRLAIAYIIRGTLAEAIARHEPHQIPVFARVPYVSELPYDGAAS
jgi:hypothetical protein